MALDTPEAFWVSVHPVTLVLILTTLGFSWKTSRRKNVLITLTGYVTILIITAVYFVPELLEITGTPFSTEIDAALTERAKMWETLSIALLFVLIVLATTLFLGLTKPGAVE